VSDNLSAKEDETRPFAKSDLRLVWRLWPLAKPLKGMMIWGALMVSAAAAVSLALPYLTKVTIDRHILPLGRLATMASPAVLPPELLGRLTPDSFLDSGRPGLWLLPAEQAALLDQRQEKALAAQGFLAPGRWYFRALTPPLEQDGAGERRDAKGAQTARPSPADSSEAQTPTPTGASQAAPSEARPDAPTALAPERAAEIAAQATQAVLTPRWLILKESDLVLLPESWNLILRDVDVRGLGRLALAFAVLMVLGYFFDLGQRYFMEAGAQRLGHNLREKLLAHLFSLRQAFFDRQEAGRLTSRLTSDINNINTLVKSTAASFFSDLLSLAGATVIMLALSVKLAAAALVLTPLAAALSYHFSREARDIQRDLRSKVSAINQAFAEAWTGMSVIQAFRHEAKTSELFEELNHQNYLAGDRQVRSVAVFLPLVDLCSSLVLALILWVGGLLVTDSTVSLGVLAAFVGYANRFFTPIKDLAEKLNTFQSAFASLERLTALLDVDEFARAETPALSPKKPGGRAEFRGVAFRYGPDLPLVLKNVSFAIEPGESVALVGSTGSGKSSLISLMLRFYDPTAGEILFDGLPLKNLDLKLHRRRIGLVTQDVYLYSATVMDNLRLGRRDLTDSQVKQAARAVGADGFIARLPLGYQEPLGPGGRGLSAGERQLIACARALIEAPEFVILDEATAFVDSETELLIEQAMKTVFAGRTSVVIAHRLSTIRRVDRIMVLNRGVLSESGDHATLLAARGLYYHLARLQGLAD
jgi:ABC-type multidrug transport system fused ATPase/permease subunit